MELTFNKDNKLYVTEFEVTSDFNLHLERDKGGKVSFYQRSTNGQYDTIEELEKNIDLVFDYDFTALVYPKTIKIVSEVEPTYAAVVSDGEITEIKSQSKEVEVTANGTTEVTPDAGFAYLNKVSVKTNVEGQGGGGTSGSAWKYYDCSNAQDQKFMLGSLFHLVKGLNNSDQSMIATTFLLTGVNTIVACAVDLSAPIKDANSDSVITMEEYYVQQGIAEMFSEIGIVEITEEEFYAL